MIVAMRERIKMIRSILLPALMLAPLLFTNPVSSTWCASLPIGCICDSTLAVICKNSLTNIPAGLPRQIHHLILQGNDIREIEAGDLAELTQLIVLDLSDNKITRIDNSAFAALQNLESLYLERNRITWLDKNSLKGLSRLRHLYLDHNSISFLPIGLFSQLPYLYELRLNDNNLHDLARHSADELSGTSLKLISLDHNPLQCNCDVLQFAQWLKESNDLLLLQGDTVRCTNRNSERRPITDLTKHDVTCAPVAKPKISHVETRSCNSIRLHWSYPTHEITQDSTGPPYSIEYSSENRHLPEFNIMIKTIDTRESSAFPRITMETASTATVEGLRSLDEYQFSVQALNEVGRGPFSDVISYKISSYEYAGKTISCVTGEAESGNIDSPPYGQEEKERKRTKDVQSTTVIIIILSVAGAIFIIIGVFTLICKVLLPRRDVLAPFQSVKFSKFIPVPQNTDPEAASSSVESVCKYNYPQSSEDAPSVRILTEIPRESVTFVRDLHTGRFGRLYLAGVKSLFPGHPPAIAMVKELRQDATEHARQSFHGQVSVMCEFEHPNVLEMFGVITVGQPLSIIYEYAEHGDLKHFLKDRLPSHDSATKLQPSLPHQRNKLVDIATQIACAMSYLASNKFVHCDLAARNCMVSSDLSIKVADLGVARELYPQDYIKVGRKMLPVRWMAPESLETMTYATESDVWSYGVTLWEIFSYGAMPYGCLADEQVIDGILKGNRLKTPENCPSKFIDVMRYCWELNPRKRATFHKIHSSLSNYCLTPSESGSEQLFPGITKVLDNKV